MIIFKDFEFYTHKMYYTLLVKTRTLILLHYNKYGGVIAVKETIKIYMNIKPSTEAPCKKIRIEYFPTTIELIRSLV